MRHPRRVHTFTYLSEQVLLVLMNERISSLCIKMEEQTRESFPLSIEIPKPWHNSVIPSVLQIKCTLENNFLNLVIHSHLCLVSSQFLFLKFVLLFSVLGLMVGGVRDWGFKNFCFLYEFCVLL